MSPNINEIIKIVKTKNIFFKNRGWKKLKYKTKKLLLQTTVIFHQKAAANDTLGSEFLVVVDCFNFSCFTLATCQLSLSFKAITFIARFHVYCYLQ